MSDRKKRTGIVYSTDPEFQYNYNEKDETETLPPREQDLRVSLDRKQRKGKAVTLIKGFVGKNEDLARLSKILKNKCGTGGSVKDGEILIQGDKRQQVGNILESEGYPFKYSGG
jgi:translation initiation factor 1